ncbi:hypothetical protein DV737_g4829, partial [Chaetothyriales sp. CBS 132003]
MAAALPTTLRSVTNTKIIELKKQRDVYESSRAAIEQRANNRGKQLERIESLLEGSFRIEGVRVPDEDSSDEEEDVSARPPNAQKLNNHRKLLKQARVDPSFPPAVVDRIQQALNKDLELKSLQHQHAQFYSELVTEWISDAHEAAQVPAADNGAMSTSNFENVGRKEMHEQRTEWESIVFSEPAVDTEAILAYLEKLFTSQKETKKVFEDMKKNIVTFCHDLKEREVFTSDSVQLAIKGLLASDLLSEDKRAILKTFSTNKEVLKEVADVLQMRFESLETWQWTTTDGAITLEQRRHLNGKYRVFMDEDVLDALLVHQIGMEWASLLKTQFTIFFHSFAWKRAADTVPLEARHRREWFLGRDDSTDLTLPKSRHESYAVDYFMTQLPESADDGPRGYGDSDDELGSTSRKNPLETKHGLLHLLITEALVARHLHPERPHSIIRSDYKWFGPSLPHPTIFTTLRFFGIDDFWRTFIRKFLDAPLRFIQDGADGQVRVRTRGIPMSHALSDVLSETVLFTGDFAINQATRRNLYRLHDDFWFWGPFDICRRAWHEMSVFASVMGIEFNTEKTGSVTLAPSSATGNDSSDDDISVDSEDYSGLPDGDIRWGFLHLNPKSTRFEIDQAMVDEHIKELKLQLDSCYSIFSYIQAYNSYASRFFTNNLCSPSLAFGREHVDAMVATFAYIQKALFPSGRVTDHLASVAYSRFDVSSIPDGFWYLPITLGGLELRNPVIPLLAMSESMHHSPVRILEKALEEDEARYLVDKENYEKKNTGSGLGTFNLSKKRAVGNIDDQQFMPKDEYLRYREERSPALARAYGQLLTIPKQQSVDLSPEVEALFNTVKTSRKRRNGGRGAHKDFDAADPYWRWIVAVYGPEIVERYGSLQMVDPGRVPLGVVGVMRAGKIRWRG